MAFNKYAAQYRKERKLLLQQIRRMEKRGYVFVKEPVPAKPKRITAASIRSLQKQRKNIYQKAVLVDTESGEVIASAKTPKAEKKRTERELNKEKTYQAQWKAFGEEGEKAPGTPGKELPGPGEEYESRSDYGKGYIPEESVYDSFSEHIIERYRNSYDMYNSEFVNYMNAWVDQLISRFGLDDVAEMIENAAADGVLITYKEAYVPGARDNYISDMMDYLPDSGDLTKEQIFEAMEEMERYDLDESMTAAEVYSL